MNYHKYSYIAFSAPAGVAYQDTIEEHWTEWLQLVEGAKWLPKGTNGACDTHARTPRGNIVEGKYPHHKLAESVYASAVWGFGIYGRRRHTTYWKNEAQRILDSLKGIKGTVVYRSELGVMDWLPLMFRDLDNWLEKILGV